MGAIRLGPQDWCHKIGAVRWCHGTGAIQFVLQGWCRKMGAMGMVPSEWCHTVGAVRWVPCDKHLMVFCFVVMGPALRLVP